MPCSPQSTQRCRPPPLLRSIAWIHPTPPRSPGPAYPSATPYQCTAPVPIPLLPALTTNDSSSPIPKNLTNFTTSNSGLVDMLFLTWSSWPGGLNIYEVTTERQRDQKKPHHTIWGKLLPCKTKCLCIDNRLVCPYIPSGWISTHKTKQEERKAIMNHNKQNVRGKTKTGKSF